MFIFMVEEHFHLDMNESFQILIWFYSFQDTFIRQLREELRVNGDVRESRSSMERFENGKTFSDFDSKLRDKDIELGHFQEELDTSRRSMELMERQYSEMKETAENKDGLVRRLRQENDSMAEKLDLAYREKTSAVQKLNLVQSDMSSLSVEKVSISFQCYYRKKPKLN